jgi:hypothetical protein
VLQQVCCKLVVEFHVKFINQEPFCQFLIQFLKQEPFCQFLIQFLVKFLVKFIK